MGKAKTQETSLNDISWPEVEWDKLEVIAVHYPEDTDNGQEQDTTH